MIENKDRPHIKDGPVKYTKGFRSKLMFSKFLNLSIILLIILIVIGSILVFIKQPVRTNDGFVITKPIYEFVEHGEKVMIIEDKSSNPFSPLIRFIFVQEVYPATIVAGPYGKIEQTQDKKRVVDGVNVIRVSLPDSEKEYLDLEYVIRKIDPYGIEIEGENDSIISKENILGGIIIDK